MRSAAPIQPPRPLRSTSAYIPDLRTYEPLAVDVRRARDADPKLVDLLRSLRSAAAKSEIAPVAAVLAPDLKIIDCDSDATQPCPGTVSTRVHRRSRPAVAKLEPEQRLLQSMCCADMRPLDVPSGLRRDAVLDVVGTLDADSLGSDPDKPDVLCSPAKPDFDRGKALEMAAAADTDPQNLRFTSRELVVRVRPSRDAPEAGRIAIHQMLPVVTDLPAPLPDGWSAVALPKGMLAYAEPEGLQELVPVNSTCFKKNEAGTWQIIDVVRRHQWGGLG